MSEPEKESSATDLLTWLTKNPARVILKALIVLAFFVAITDGIARLSFAWILANI